MAALFSREYERELHHVVEHYPAALFWTRAGERGTTLVRNGTTFFVDSGSAIFGITAGHVFEQFRADSERLAGVIRECLYGIAELVRAVRADFIRDDGTIGDRG